MTGGQALEAQNTQDQANLEARLNDLLGGGTVQQATQQTADTAAYAEFLRQQGWTDQQIAAATSALGAVSGSANTTTTGSGTTDLTQPNNSLYTLAGAALGAGANYAGSAAGSAALATLI